MLGKLVETWEVLEFEQISIVSLYPFAYKVETEF